MELLLPWLNQNWFILVQTLGIIGSLLITLAALRRDTRSRKMGDLLALAGHHRELWTDAHRRPELERIFRKEVDLLARPITASEEEFLNLVIVHFHTGWQLAQEGTVHSLETLKADVCAFFSLPLPGAVWAGTKYCRDLAFVRFVDAALSRK